MKYSTHHVPGRLGEMTCTCGGRLREFHTIIVPEYDPPHHRKKRIRKKWRKRWERENPILRGVCAMAGLMQRPWYRCEKCGKRDGFYSAVGRNFIKIEPLPDGALPLYDWQAERHDPETQE